MLQIFWRHYLVIQDLRVLIMKTGILKGYVQRDLFDEQALKNIISDFPIEGLSITYEVKEAEDRDWNEEWEESGFRPIIIGRTLFHP